MRRIIVGIVTLSIVAYAIGALAQPTPKPTPAVTGNFCVNNATGTLRNVLVKNGVVQACRKNEQLVAIINFDSAPTPDPTSTTAPSPGATPTPTPAPSASPTVGGDPSNCTNCVVDSTGAEVGPLTPIGNDSAQEEAVVVSVNGVALGLPANQSGWIDLSQNNIALLLWYPQANCQGQGYISVVPNPPSDAQPLVELWGVQEGPWITGNTVWYANPPLSIITPLSFYSTTDPTVPPNANTCQNAQQGTNFGNYLAGPPASGSLADKGTPPFSWQ